MWQRIKCWLGDLFKKDWHEWETLYTRNSEYEPNLIYEQKQCKICGQIISVTKGKVKR